MRLIKAAVNSYLWIGFGAVASYFYTCSLDSELEFNTYIGLFLWASTTCLYNLLGSFKRKTSVLKHLLLSLTALIAGISFFRFAEIRDLLYLAPSVIVGFFYGFKGGLRLVPYLKVFLIACIWVYTTSVVPQSICSVTLDRSDLILVFAQFFFLLGITIPFDVRDIQYDSPHMRTFPQVFGVKQSIYISGICVMLSGVIISLLSYEITMNKGFWAVLIWVPISLLAVLKTTSSRHNLYFTFILDGLLILQGLAALIIYQI